MLKKGMTHILLIGLLLGLTGTAFAIGNTVLAQNNPLLQLNDLPTGAIEPKNETYTREQIYHPVNNNELSGFHRLPEDEQKVLFSYGDVLSFSAFLQEEKVFVAHYVYVYETSEQARTAVAILQRSFEDGPQVVKAEDHQGHALRGRGSLLLNDKGEPTYWFIGHEGKNLNLLLVDGLDVSGVDSVANSLLAKLFKKTE